MTPLLSPAVSVRQQVPAVLLVLSRALMLAGPLAAPPPRASSPADILAATPPVSAQHQALLETVASMDAETVQEVVVAQVRAVKQMPAVNLKNFPRLYAPQRAILPPGHDWWLW